MAKLKDPMGCRSVSGKIGGMRYACGGGGQIVRARGGKARTPSVAQSRQRYLFAALNCGMMHATVDELNPWWVAMGYPPVRGGKG